MAYKTKTERHQKPRSGIAMGGLGCGWYEIRQDGQFQNWMIANNKPLFRGAKIPFDAHNLLFFIVWYQVEGEEPRMQLLQVEESHGSAAICHTEYQYIYPWLDGVDRIDFEGTFPFARLIYDAQRMPLEVSLEAWSPFIPRDAKNSSLPAAFYDFKIRSYADKPVDIFMLGSLRNIAGYDVKYKHYTHRIIEEENVLGVCAGTTSMDERHSSFGNASLCVVGSNASYYAGWEHIHPYYELLLENGSLLNRDDTAGRNTTDKETGRPAAMERCWSSVGRRFRLEKAGEEAECPFLHTWYFPNNYAQMPDDTDQELAGDLENPDFPGNSGDSGEAQGNAKATTEASKTAGERIAQLRREGHYYSNFFDSSKEVAIYLHQHRKDLKERTQRFHHAFYESSLPEEILDQINSHLNTFRTSSWLTKDGDFGIIEGLSPDRSFAGLATTDVAMYGGVATAMLFPEMDRRVTLAHARLQQESGIVLHSIPKNFAAGNEREGSGKRIDMPQQFAYMALRAYYWCGDWNFLESIWPHVKLALDYILRERDANQDSLPDMEGIMCSYDNFPMYGVAPYVSSQFLAALSLAIETAKEMGDEETSMRYRRCLRAGVERMEETTWNGKYYRLYANPERIQDKPEADEGCLTDQIIGIWACHLVGMKPFLKHERIQSALKSIMEMNYHPEYGVRNCRWPEDSFRHPVADDCWVDQANTCWTGVELAFASFLIYEGQYEEGMRVIRNVDRRYRHYGLYWDHQEFGGHYFRPMSALAILPACLGMSVQKDQIFFTPQIKANDYQLLYVTAHGYGHFICEERKCALQQIDGHLKARALYWNNLPDSMATASGHQLSIDGHSLEEARLFPHGEWDLCVEFPEPIELRAGNTLTIRPL